MSDPTQITVLVSGQGTNLEAIISAIAVPGVLNARINGVISNKEGVYALTRANNASLATFTLSWDKKVENRAAYDDRVIKQILDLRPATNLVVLAGWMHLLSKDSLATLRANNIQIINLHPALPGQFPGAHAIVEAWEAAQRGEITHTGVMVHHVVAEMDAGEVITSTKIPIYPDDSVEVLSNRIRYHEKGVLLQAIQEVLSTQTTSNQVVPTEPSYPVKIGEGKVREIWDLGYNVLALVHTNRASSFDRHICDVPQKGRMLTEQTAYWFKKTSGIAPNHYLHHQDNVMIVKRARPFLVEVVLRNYITGSTSTSLWTHYARGERTYCGLKFPEGLVKHQKLPQLVITPTTKDEHDEPISSEEVVSRGLVGDREWLQICQYATRLFQYASIVAAERGYILVDTKMEFGIDVTTNQVMVIDELFTCDSSRYWEAGSYAERMAAGQDPKSLDKDLIRRWVKSQCDPYNDPIPEVPAEIVNKVSDVYQEFSHQMSGFDTKARGLRDDGLTNPLAAFDTYFKHSHSPTVVIISGSTSDQAHVEKIQDALTSHGIYSVWEVCSAHKQTEQLILLLERYNEYYAEGRKIAFCCVAGRSNALGAVTACNVSAPVVSCPPFSSKDDYLINIHSSLQNPSKVPSATIIDPGNCALFFSKMFGLLN